jgi:hypothetical protein
VFGFRLLPLTVGHVFAISRLTKSVLTDATVPVTDLLGAVLICADESGDAERNATAWYSGLVFRFWGLKIRRMNASVEADKFREYCDHWLARPEIVNSRGASEFGTDWHLRLLALLIGECGLTLDEALSLPVRDANELVVALGESRGQLKVWTNKQESLWQFAQEQDRLKASRMSSHVE